VSVTNPTVTTTVNVNDFVWSGAVSTAWNTRNNWLQWNGSSYDFPAAHPNSSASNVILPSTSQTCVVNASRIGNLNIQVNNFTIEAGHTFQLNNANAVFRIFGDFGTTGTWNTPTAGSTVIYEKNGDQSIRNATYSNLQTAGSGIKTLLGNCTVNLTCTVGNGTTLALSNRTLTLPKPDSPFVLNGSLNAGAGTVTYSSTTGDQNITPATYYNLTTSGNPSNKALTGTTTVTIAGGISGQEVTIDTKGDISLSALKSVSVSGLDVSVSSKKTIAIEAKLGISITAKGSELLDLLTQLIDEIGGLTVSSPVGPCAPIMGSPTWAKVMAVQAKLKLMMG
jgi:hypothetical protein